MNSSVADDIETEISAGDERLWPWYALHVRTRGEAKLKTALESKGFTTFLPTYTESRKYSDRVKKVAAPLFPGYLFCRMDVTKRLPLLMTPGLHSIVGNMGVPQAIDEKEIDAIRRVVGANIAAVPWPYLKAGDRVVVQYGSLAGVEGALVRDVRGDKLVLSVHLLQRSISLEIERDWVKPLTVQIPSSVGKGSPDNS